MATIPSPLPTLYDIIAQCRGGEIQVVFLNSKAKYDHFSRGKGQSGEGLGSS